MRAVSNLSVSGLSGQIYMANMAYIQLPGNRMIRATISEVKDGMSAYLRRVKSGESVLVMERRTPIARIVPVGLDSDGGREGDSVDREAKLARLEQAGIVVRRGSGSPLDVLGQPLRPGAGVLEALLEERSEESREGYR